MAPENLRDSSHGLPMPSRQHPRRDCPNPRSASQDESSIPMPRNQSKTNLR